ncbi:MAG: sulfatase-like hydrolase/transferase [Rikenellaceae bacterium]
MNFRVKENYPCLITLLPCVTFISCSQLENSVTSAGSLKNSKANIIFIFADDWGYGDLSAHGHSELRTPNLDKMISEGMDFKQFNVCSPVSSSSRVGVITGNFPSRHGIHQQLSTLETNKSRCMPHWLSNDADMVLLPRLLQSAGYKTAHYGKWHLTSNHAVDIAPIPKDYGYDDAIVYNGGGAQVEDGPVGYESSVWTEYCVDYTIDFIEKNKANPFFVNLWIHESHQDIQPTPLMREQYPNTAEPYQSYYSVITSADSHIGRLMDYLKEAGLDENTLVIFSSDNGPETPDDGDNWTSRGQTAGLRGQKRSLYEGGVKVPFIVYMPGTVPKGKVNDVTQFAAVDLLPTFASIAGVDLPDDYECDGEDVLDLFENKSFEKTKPVLQYWQGLSDTDTWPRLSAKDNTYKLVSDEYEEMFMGGTTKLYNHLNDWGEDVNLLEDTTNPSYDKYLSKAQELYGLVQTYYNEIDFEYWGTTWHEENP